jgi:hypothetical protein
MSSLVLKSIHPSLYLVLRAVFLEVKREGREADNLPPPTAEAIYCGAISPLPIRLTGVYIYLLLYRQTSHAVSQLVILGLVFSFHLLLDLSRYFPFRWCRLIDLISWHQSHMCHCAQVLRGNVCVEKLCDSLVIKTRNEETKQADMMR